MSTIRAGERRADRQAADSIPSPQVAPLFWAFRIMVALGFGFIAVMAYFFWRQASGRAIRAGRCDGGSDHPDAVDRGGAWLVRRRVRPPALDGGRRAADGLSVSHLSVQDLLITLAGFVTFYTVLFIDRDGPDAEIHPQGPRISTWLKPKPGGAARTPSAHP
jgi:cytochrome d ubiquinol oxidase subunit I